MTEMELIYVLAERSLFFKTMHSNVSSLTHMNYAMVVALNINIFLSPLSLQRPFKAMLEFAVGISTLSNAEQLR